ncbi:MAG TPA: glycosyltransferase family 39 protein [Blastocatellia bacterium]|nr:glycosyltransferase family 39 protein [Blastocatellia bacterium]
MSSGVSTWNRARGWLSGHLEAPREQDAAPSLTSKNTRRRIALLAWCALIFLAALGVRQLHWQDYHLQVGSDLESLVHRYKKHAEMALSGEGILFPRDYAQRSNVQLLVHPPGYSIFIAAIYALSSDSDDNLVLSQIVSDGIAAVLVFLIGAQWLSRGAAVAAGLLVAFSPHLAHYTLVLLPDSLAVLPILICVYLVALAVKRPRLITIIAAGAMTGLSCWLRSNALLLAPFLALFVPFLFPRGTRLKYAAAFVGAAIAVFLPITLRNWIVFHHFIPLSLGSGITMVEGIGDYDKEKRFGMPADDREGKWKDVEWHSRPDYAAGLWKPDGIERDRYRFSRGLQVIRGNPRWFGGVMIRRAASMLRSNDSFSQGWPADTCRKPIISAEPTFGHGLALSAQDQPMWSSSAAELLAGGAVLSQQTMCLPGQDGETIRVVGDGSDFGDQFASAPILVEKNADYVLQVPLVLIQGRMAAKVTSQDRRIMLASDLILEPEEGGSKHIAPEVDDEAGADEIERPASEEDLASTRSTSYALMPFASGNRSEVRFVVSNNGSSSSRSTAEIGSLQLFAVGQTPHQWSRIVRPAVRGIQRNLFTTTHMLPLIGAGIILLAIAGRRRALLLLLGVPAYYLCVQSAFHTEYRYILAIHYLLFVSAGVTLYLSGAALSSGARGLARATRRLF